MKIITSILLMFTVAALSFAQGEPDKKATELLLKIKHIDLMNQILPLLLTKDQLKEILPVVEKTRQKVKQHQAKELTELKQFEARIDAELKAASTDGKTPDRQLVADVMKLFAKMSIERGLIADENTDAVLTVMKKTLNEGQIKAAINALDPKLFNLKPEEMSSDDKLRFFIREIFLDPAAYDVLLIINKKAN